MILFELKFSEILLEDIKGYLNVFDNDSDLLIQTFLDSAKAYIRGYTGQNDLYLDEQKDIVVALYMLVEQYYDGHNNHEKSIENILNLHPNNLV
ncbi:phage gp6-like head-tail connector protein [Clostridium perfringens]|nr:phage gp6-like head-tail connector protein [Clostridium perfringens]PWX15108.1 phage gp6-like head-tail connector protein [Clostridium perfringens]PWX35763.1 phage gp6-like head-tail connector protein [Clostridium perfringens]PWX59914.1 phage gp6-like head-tail connector protein [Clostridium perfringens]